VPRQRDDFSSSALPCAPPGAVVPPFEDGPTEEARPQNRPAAKPPLDYVQTFVTQADYDTDYDADCDCSTGSRLVIGVVAIAAW